MGYKKYILLSFVLLLACAAAGVGGYFFGVYKEHALLIKNLSSIRPIRQANSPYKFVDPLLAYIVPSADQEGQYASLKKQMVDLIATEKKSNNIIDAAIYFNDLNHSKWVGVNELSKYDPASMLKVVIMV